MDRLPSEPTPADLEQTLKVAKGFRGVLVYFGSQYLIGFLLNVAQGIAEASPDGALVFGLAALALLAAAIACLVMLLVQVYKCSSAMGSIGLLWVIAMFFPCVNLLTLLAINSKAKTFLEARGVKVGFLGPSPNEIMRLERALGR